MNKDKKPMFDTIHKIEDFKNIIKQEKLRRDDLRIDVQEKSVGEFTTQVDVVLTIPKNKYAILRYVMKGFFNTYFYKDKDWDEHKRYKELIERTYATAKKHFGEIVEGYWSTD